MLQEFHIKKLKCDMMGYYPQKKDVYTAHHLIIPAREGGKLYRWNTAVLLTTPHEYLHRIENVDFDIFSAITSEMVDMNFKGYLDKENLHYIDDALKYFEHEYCSATTKKGKPLIKEQYLHRNHFMI